MQRLANQEPRPPARPSLHPHRLFRSQPQLSCRWCDEYRAPRHHHWSGPCLPARWHSSHRSASWTVVVPSRWLYWHLHQHQHLHQQQQQHLRRSSMHSIARLKLGARVPPRAPLHGSLAWTRNQILRHYWFSPTWPCLPLPLPPFPQHPCSCPCLSRPPWPLPWAGAAQAPTPCRTCCTSTPCSL